MFSIKQKGIDQTIHWWPTSGPNSFVPKSMNQVYKIMVPDYEFLDVKIETHFSSRSYYVSAVLVRRQDNASVNVDFTITHEFMQDLGFDYSKPFNDIYVESFVNTIEKEVGWGSMYSKHAKTQKQMKKQTTQSYYEELYNQKHNAPHYYNPTPNETIKEHVEKERKRNEVVINELREQIQELKEELEMLKAINQEC
jgi:hypothetical protein